MQMISVIIPVYNTARWLPQCLDSVLGQDYRAIEVILVNDASTDNSLAVCKRYAAKDSRIVLIDKPENEGLERARRSGLAVAKGEYVMHVDSDDWLDHATVLSSMHAKAEETQADYVEIGEQRVLDRHKWITQKNSEREELVICQPELFDKYYISFFGVNVLSVNVWGKLYRKSTLDKIKIHPLGLCIGEDLAYNMQIFPHLEKICVSGDVGYNYRLGGMTGRYNPHLLSDLKRLYLLKEELIDKYSYDKARDWTRIELKNVLKSDICQRITYHIGGGKTAVIAHIAAEIDDPVYARMCEVDESLGFLQDPFVKAFVEKDAEKMYELCRRRVRKERPQRLLKQIGYKLLNLI